MNLRQQGEWVYAIVGKTEVRGKKTPTGKHIEQVSSTYDVKDFDTAVNLIDQFFDPGLSREERPEIPPPETLTSSGKRWFSGPKPLFPGESTSEFIRRQPEHCCAIKDTLIKQLKDEEEGTIFYAQVAGELGLIGEDGLADVLNYISDNEFKHYLELRGIIDVLTEQCDCQRKTLGPPFG